MQVKAAGPSGTWEKRILRRIGFTLYEVEQRTDPAIRSRKIDVRDFDSAWKRVWRLILSPR